jgi:hypothetical protein
MRNHVLFFLLIASLVCIPWTVIAAKPVKVEVLYMNHGPLQDTLSSMRKIFSQYKEKVSVSWHDFDTKEGEQFMAKKGIKQHIPLVIWMDNQVKLKVGAEEITFAGFPTGAGPQFFQGKWTLADLQKALDQLTNNK